MAGIRLLVFSGSLWGDFRIFSEHFFLPNLKGFQEPLRFIQIGVLSRPPTQISGQTKSGLYRISVKKLNLKPPEKLLIPKENRFFLPSKKTTPMKILLWNLERPKKTQKRTTEILEKISSFDADIIVLTETNSCINPGKSHQAIASHELKANLDGIDYSTGENRATIYTKFGIVEKIQTSDDFTNASAKLDTPLGELLVYAGITGIFGGIGQRFGQDLEKQLSDWNKLDKSANLILAGDFNTTLSGRAYPSRKARETFLGIAERLELEIPTSEIETNVDHIFISRKLIVGKNVKLKTWNEDLRLSDHIGILLTIS